MEGTMHNSSDSRIAVLTLRMMLELGISSQWRNLALFFLQDVSPCSSTARFGYEAASS